jgi:hypothetical protein
MMENYDLLFFEFHHYKKFTKTKEKKSNKIFTLMDDYDYLLYS